MLFCMRTTLNLQDDLMRAAKQEAAQRGITLTALMEEALREHLRNSEERASQSFRLRLVTVEGGPTPGVDLDDRRSLYDAMDDPRAVEERA
jgi:hypothetical protein